jgi:glycosyltransferase involved in cell wall biosynthesis
MFGTLERVLLFWTPDLSIPSGGIKQIYRHAELLQRAGIEARVLHTQRGFVCDWFEHRAPLAYLGETLPRGARRRIGEIVSRASPMPDLDLVEGRSVRLYDDDEHVRNHVLSERDVVIMPEYLGVKLRDAHIELPMVIFNQNVHTTFRGYGFDDFAGSAIYMRPNVLGAVVVSEHSKKYLEHTFEGLEVHRVINGVDSSLFHPNDPPKKRQLAFMPRRMPDHLEQVINILAIRGALEGWELAPISGVDEGGVAEILRHSFIYLSTCKEEGFGLPPVEAGMSGCLVVGYTGTAADEYFLDGLCERIDQDDVLGFAQAVERLMKWVEDDPEAALSRGRAFSELLTERYSLAREEESVLAVWNALIGKQARAVS